MQISTQVPGLHCNQTSYLNSETLCWPCCVIAADCMACLCSDEASVPAQASKKLKPHESEGKQLTLSLQHSVAVHGITSKEHI